MLLRTFAADEHIDRQPTCADGQDFGHQIKGGKHCDHDADPPFSWDRTIRLLFAAGSRPLNSLRRRGWYRDKGYLIWSLSQYIYWVHLDDVACPSPILRKNEVEVASVSVRVMRSYIYRWDAIRVFANPEHVSSKNLRDTRCYSLENRLMYTKCQRKLDFHARWCTPTHDSLVAMLSLCLQAPVSVTQFGWRYRVAGQNARSSGSPGRFRNNGPAPQFHMVPSATRSGLSGHQPLGRCPLSYVSSSSGPHSLCHT